jgi:hypothetical protein
LARIGAGGLTTSEPVIGARANCRQTGRNNQDRELELPELQNPARSSADLLQNRAGK